MLSEKEIYVSYNDKQALRKDKRKTKKKVQMLEDSKKKIDKMTEKVKKIKSLHPPLPICFINLYLFIVQILN